MMSGLQRSPKCPRQLVLHADDFGMNPAVNRGILAAFSDGLLTSTSLLANAPAFDEAIDGWNELDSRHQNGQLPSSPARRRLGDPSQPFDIGVHLNLTQGRPLTGDCFPANLLDRDGRFLSVFQLLPRLLVIGRRFRAAIKSELCAQIDRCFESGVMATHLNGHQYVEMLPTVAEMLPDLLDRYQINAVRVAWEPYLTRTTLRHQFQPAQWGLAQVKRLFAFDFLVRTNRAAIRHPHRYFGTAHAGRIDLSLLAEFIAASGPGVTEIGVHPGAAVSPVDVPANDGWLDPLATDRPRELACLTSPELVDLLASQRIELTRLGRVGRLGAQQVAA